MKDVPPYAVVVGVPATIIKYSFSEKKAILISTLSWKLPTVTSKISLQMLYRISFRKISEISATDKFISYTAIRILFHKVFS